MKVMLVFNPAAGQRDVRQDLHEAIEYLKDQGWQITSHCSQAPHDITLFARQAAAEGYDVLLVVGGNGTLNEAVNGLVGSRVALGVLPIGTGNVWALEVGIPTATPLHPHNLLPAAQALVEGKIRTVDLGQARERYFLMWAGIGFDATVAQEIETQQRELKHRLGPLAYVIRGMVIALSFMGTPVQFILDGQPRQGRVIMAVISNTCLYGAILRLAPEARLDDGLLDVVIFKGQGFLSTLRHLIAMLLGRHVGDPEVEYHRARTVEVESNKPLLVQVDGDPLGSLPMRFRIVPRALRVLVPSHVPEELFGQP